MVKGLKGGADGETRTLTPVAPAPKAGVSTNFTTSAYKKVVLPARFERATYALEGRCSIQLS